jgi:hypothetical protein
MHLVTRLKKSYSLFGFTAIATSIFLFWSSEIQAQRDVLRETTRPPNCSIIFGESGRNYSINPVTGFVSDDQPRANFPTLDREVSPARKDAFSFIRLSSGRCIFVMYDEVDYGGRVAVYGAVEPSEPNDKVRIGAEGSGGRGEGWRASSMRVFAVNDDCSIVLGDGGISQRFYGPGIGRLRDGYTSITGWDFIRETSGPCTFTVFNEPGLNGRSRQFTSGIRENIRVGWRIRSVRIE